MEGVDRHATAILQDILIRLGCIRDGSCGKNCKTMSKTTNSVHHMQQVTKSKLGASMSYCRETALGKLQKKMHAERFEMTTLS